MGYFDFPHTRNYDTDLGFLIKRYKQLIIQLQNFENDTNAKLDDLQKQIDEVFGEIKEHIADITKEQLNEWLADGTIGQIIDDYYKSISGEMKVRYLASINPTTDDYLGDCAVIQTTNKVGIVDFGYNPYETELLTFLNNNNIKKIDFVIISHYHDDHIGRNGALGFKVFMAQDFDFTGCQFFLPHKNIQFSSWVGSSTTIQNNQQAVIDTITQKGLSANIVYPTENQEFIIDNNVSVTFNNLESNFFQSYYSRTIGSQLTDSGSTNYNNFSMFATFKHFNNIFWFTGDVEITAQKNIAKYLKPCDVYKIEHHSINNEIDIKYASLIKPKYGIIQQLHEAGFYANYGLYQGGMLQTYGTGGTVYNTAYNGDITVISYYNGLECECSQSISDYNINPLNTKYAIKPLEYGTDINDLIEPGVYYSPNATWTSNLKNIPVTSGFYMEVIQGARGVGSPIQKIYSLNAYPYYELFRNKTGGNWHPWNIQQYGNGYFDLDQYIPIQHDSTSVKCMSFGGIVIVVLSLTVRQAVDTSTYIVNVPITNDKMPVGVFTTESELHTANGDIYPCVLSSNNAQGIAIYVRPRKAIPNGTILLGTFVTSLNLQII